MKRGRPKTHGMSKTRPNRIWTNMKTRCYYLLHKQYKDYGGKGVSVCSRWLNSFNDFWEDMQTGYNDNLQLDRIDTNGDYSPQNCRWITPKENCAGRIRNGRPKGSKNKIKNL